MKDKFENLNRELAERKIPAKLSDEKDMLYVLLAKKIVGFDINGYVFFVPFSDVADWCVFHVIAHWCLLLHLCYFDDIVSECQSVFLCEFFVEEQRSVVGDEDAVVHFAVGHRDP